MCRRFARRLRGGVCRVDRRIGSGQQEQAGERRLRSTGLLLEGLERRASRATRQGRPPRRARGSDRQVHRAADRLRVRLPRRRARSVDDRRALGTTVRIENRDAFTHELSVDGLAGFTPLESGPGKARAIPVPAGGPWELGDRIYGHVDGHLHSMRELVACATVTPSGKFRFDNVPPGPYSLRILRGSEQVAVRRVTVPAGKTLKVDPLTMSKSRRK